MAGAVMLMLAALLSGAHPVQAGTPPQPGSPDRTRAVVPADCTTPVGRAADRPRCTRDSCPTCQRCDSKLGCRPLVCPPGFTCSRALNTCLPVLLPGAVDKMPGNALTRVRQGPVRGVILSEATAVGPLPAVSAIR